MNSQPLRIEVWSDVVCPWCYIGKRRLELALRDFDGAVEVVHRAFQLDPSTPTEGRLTVDLLAEKYRVGPEQASQMMADVSEVARGVGLEYALDRTRSGNTRDAHRLLLWAQEHSPDAAQALLERIYDAYFVRADSVFTADDLIPLVSAVGLDPDAARTVLASDAYREAVLADQRFAQELGANGVPFFVIDRRYGISGAQPLEVFRATLEQAVRPA